MRLLKTHDFLERYTRYTLEIKDSEVISLKGNPFVVVLSEEVGTVSDCLIDLALLARSIEGKSALPEVRTENAGDKV